MVGDSQPSPARIECIHCGGTHQPGLRRCPSTGRALGGDPRLIGQLIARRYRVLRLLGDGPFGASYKAEHIAVGRQVSLRILPPWLVSHPVALNRFFREARLVGSVRHEHLQPLLDAGLSDDGLAYVAYQYVRGRSLTRALVQNTVFSLTRAATLVCEILEGLDAIHASGFVHRAIMPESVMLQVGGSGLEHAMLTNFGAATFEESGPAEPFAQPTHNVNLPNRGYYTPPERSRAAPPDRREDIYGAGVVLAALLCPGGVPRFGGDLLAIGVPATVEAIVARATHTAPAARYASARDMLYHVKQFAEVSYEDAVSVTETVINDLRIIRNRERVLQVIPARFRLESGRTEIVSGLAGALIRAIKKESGQRWSEIVLRVPGIETLLSLETSRALVPNMRVVAGLEEADALCGTDDRLFCVLLGEAAGRSELNALIQQAIGGAPTPEFLLDELPSVWSKVIGYGTPRARQVGKGYGRFEVRDQLDASFAFCSAIAGIIKAALENAGAQSVEVSKTSCESVGDAACVYSVTWA